MKALWRGEVVTVVSVKGGKVQIAWSCGLRWVKPDELAEAHRAAGNVYGKLLNAEDAYVREAERLSVERARLERALEILEAK